MNRSRNENYRNQGDGQGWNSERNRRPSRYSNQDFERFNQAENDFGRQSQSQYGNFRSDRYTNDDMNSFREDDDSRLSRGQNFRGRINSTYNQDYNSPDYGGYGQDFESSRYSRGEHFGKGPKGYKRSVERITEEVNESLYRSGSVDATDIEVSMDGDTVVLKGSVSSREAKREAERCIENVSGVDDVRNELKVKRELNSGSGSSSTQSNLKNLGKTGSLS